MHRNARMAESVDATVSNTVGAIRPGSTPGSGTDRESSSDGSRFNILTMDKFKILFRPSKEDKKLILEALQKTGFSNGVLQPHDFERIRKSFENNHAIIHYINNYPMGFTTWESEKNVAVIHYKWILQEYTGKGIGHLFSQMIYKRFLKKGKPNITPTGNGRELVIWKDYSKDEAPTQAYRIDDDMENIPVLAIVNPEGEMEIRQDGRPVISKRCKDFFRNTECLQSGVLLYLRTNISEIINCCK